MPRADDSGGRPALDDLRRPLECRLGGEHAARGLHDEEPSAHTRRGQSLDHGAEVEFHRRADIGVDHGRAGALVLADLRQHLGRQGDERSRQLGAEAGADLLLMDRIGEGVDQADGHRLHLGGADSGDHRLEACLIEGPHDAAVGADALHGFESQAPWHERRRLLPQGGIEPRDAHAAQLQHVAEALRGDQRGAGALVLEDGVGGNRAAMQHLCNVLGKPAPMQ